jgi:recombination protein RecT
MAENQLVQQSNPQLVAIQNALKGANKSIQAALKENAGTFNTSLMELITSDANLMKCDPKKLMAEAVKAASIKLPLNKQLGYAYLVPYGTTPNMIIGYRGYIQLAMRTGQYRYINADVVYEGELSHKDKLTGAITLDGEKTSETVVGYFAHFELLNGCCKTLYMSIDEMANYALTYSGAWAKKPKDQKPSAEKLMERAQVQAQNGPEPGVGWWSNFNAMARKTVLRRLLSQYGYLSIEMMQALAHDEQPVYASAETIRDTENATAKPVFDANSMIQEAEEVKEEESEPSPI